MNMLQLSRLDCSRVFWDVYLRNELAVPVRPSTLINPWNHLSDFEVLPWTRADFESLWYEAGFLLYKKSPIGRKPTSPNEYWTTTSRKVSPKLGNRGYLLFCLADITLLELLVANPHFCIVGEPPIFGWPSKKPPWRSCATPFTTAWTQHDMVDDSGPLEVT